MTGGDVRQEPEGVLEVRQQTDVGVGKRRPRSCLEVLDHLRRILAANDVQPFLDVTLVLELRSLARAGRLEKCVEVELIELASARDGYQLVWHLVGEEAHLRQRTIGIPFVWVAACELLS